MLAKMGTKEWRLSFVVEAKQEGEKILFGVSFAHQHDFIRKVTVSRFHHILDKRRHIVRATIGFVREEEGEDCPIFSPIDADFAVCRPPDKIDIKLGCRMAFERLMERFGQCWVNSLKLDGSRKEILARFWEKFLKCKLRV